MFGMEQIPSEVRNAGLAVLIVIHIWSIQKMLIFDICGFEG